MLYGCFASLSMTDWWMLRFAQHDLGITLAEFLL
jgi:hypothetical protein